MDRSDRAMALPDRQRITSLDIVRGAVMVLMAIDHVPLLYVVFFIVVAALWVPCRWFAHVTSRRPTAWLRYL